MALVGHQMVSMAAWVADQEREVGRRRTKEGLAAARARGKTLGRRRSLTDDQVQLARRMKDTGASGRKIAQLLGGQRKDGPERPEGGTVNICVTTASRTRPGSLRQGGTWPKEPLCWDGPGPAKS